MTADTSKRELVELMVGRQLSFSPNRLEVEVGAPRLQKKNLVAESDRDTPALRGINRKVASGEILGLAGVSGNGQPELAQVINSL
jgi:simple sugar transport system ATP-binding protein